MRQSVFRPLSWKHMFGDNEPTPLRRAIIAAYDRSPDADPATIAEECGCSTSYARKSIEHHRG